MKNKIFHDADIVKVNKDINDKIKNGMIGTIVYSFEEYNVYEVEFVDSEGYTIDLLTLNEKDLNLIKAYRDIQQSKR